MRTDMLTRPARPLLSAFLLIAMTLGSASAFAHGPGHGHKHGHKHKHAAKKAKKKQARADRVTRSYVRMKPLLLNPGEWFALADTRASGKRLRLLAQADKSGRLGFAFVAFDRKVKMRRPRRANVVIMPEGMSIRAGGFDKTTSVITFLIDGQPFRLKLRGFESKHRGEPLAVTGFGSAVPLDKNGKAVLDPEDREDMVRAALGSRVKFRRRARRKKRHHKKHLHHKKHHKHHGR